MNSTLRLRDLAQEWEKVPFSDCIDQAANQLLEDEQNSASHTTTDFNVLLTRIYTSFAACTHRHPAAQEIMLGEAISLLHQSGRHEVLHAAYVASNDEATRETILTLRDAFLRQLQQSHRAFLLQRYCGTQKQRERIATKFVAACSADTRSPNDVWQSANDIPTLLNEIAVARRRDEQWAAR